MSVISEIKRGESARNKHWINAKILLIEHGKNDFAERSKILLDTDLKMILLDHQNNFVGTLKMISNAAKNFDILADSLSVLHNYFDSSTKLFF